MAKGVKKNTPSILGSDLTGKWLPPVVCVSLFWGDRLTEKLWASTVVEMPEL